MKFLLLTLFLTGCAGLGQESRYLIMSGERFCDCRQGVDHIKFSETLDRYAEVVCRDGKSSIVLRESFFIPKTECKGD